MSNRRLLVMHLGQCWLMFSYRASQFDVEAGDFALISVQLEMKSYVTVK